MELRQLRYFIKVAERLSVSEAAKDLCITQSTLSQQIRQLENELGVQLFDRTSRGVKLTEMGVEMLPYAAKTVQDAEVCVDHISDIQNLKAGVLRVGVSYSFASNRSRACIPWVTKTISNGSKSFKETVFLFANGW